MGAGWPCAEWSTSARVVTVPWACAAQQSRGASAENAIVDVLALDSALTELHALDERLCRVVELRYFAGLNIAETADALDVSSATVERDWTVSKAWLLQRLSSLPEHNG